MQLFFFIAFTFLCNLSFLSSQLPIQCNKTQYAWPVEKATLCCNKCPPGEHMIQRAPESCDITCEPCTGPRYSPSYNEELSCKICQSCNGPNLQTELPCNVTHNAVCTCEAGYRCNDHPCKNCIKIETTRPPSNTIFTSKPLPTPSKPIRDTVWFLVIIAVLCAGCAFIVLIKIKPILQWIRSRECNLFPDKPGQAPVLQYSDEEEVSKPVQEVCGKCDVNV